MDISCPEVHQAESNGKDPSPPLTSSSTNGQTCWKNWSVTLLEGPIPCQDDEAPRPPSLLDFKLIGALVSPAL